MKKKLLILMTSISITTSFFAVSSESDENSQYLSNWWNQSINVVSSYNTRFGPQLRNDTYLEYEAFAKKEWFDFYGYLDAPVFFGGNSEAKGIWNKGSPLFMEIEPRFSIDKLTGLDLSFAPFKEWYFANDYVYDMGKNKNGRQSTWFMGLGTDIDTGLPISLSLNIYAKYQWQNYGAENENQWDGYRFKLKYFVPITELWGGKVNYIGFTNFDWGSDLGDKSGYAKNNIKQRTNNSIASSHILVLNYDHWHYSMVARYWHNGGQWNNGADPVWMNNNIHSNGWGGYFVIGYNF